MASPRVARDRDCVSAYSRARARFAAAGGADTYRDLYVLPTLDRDQRVRSSAKLRGFIPGKGVGFVPLTDRRVADRARLPVVAALSLVGEDIENGNLCSRAPYRGVSLAEAVGRLFGTERLRDPVRGV